MAMAAGEFDEADPVEGRCSVADGTSCDLLDIVLIGRVTGATGGSFDKEACQAANP